MSVGKKLFKGAIWNSISEFGSQGINFIILVLLARLLAPKDFGLVGMAAVFISFLGYLTEFGLFYALIQAREIDEDDCHTVFCSTLLFSSIIYLVMFFCAPAIAAFYHEESLTLIIRILFIVHFLAAFAYIPEAMEIRSLRYDRIAVADLIGLMVSGLVAIILALFKFGVWSLVIQQVAMTFIRSAALIIYTKWYPRTRFSFMKFKVLFRSGANFTLKNLIFYCSKNIDSLLIGKLLGPTALGIYTLSLRIAGYASTKVWMIFGKMLIPAFVLFQNQIERVKKNFIRVSVAGGIILIPLLISLFFGTTPIVTLLFGEKWLAVIPIIKIFIIYKVVDSLFLSDESILIALDKIKAINIVRTISSLALLTAGYVSINKFGLTGMAATFTAVSVLTVIALKALLLALLKIRLHDYLKDLKIVFITTLGLSALLGFYSLCIDQSRMPLLFLFGEAIIVTLFGISLIVKYKLINLNDRKINFDNLLSAKL